MSRGFRRQAPALVIACVALVAALGGTVYAAKRINGKTIRAKSLPGNRLVPRSVPGNRLKPGALTGNSLAPGSITGIQIDASTLGQVPSAVYADNAESARDAQTALNAVNAIDATRVNGHTAGCEETTRFFAGACWQTGSSETAVDAPTAAESCATQGGELPSALALAAFSHQPGIALDPEDEWTGDPTNASSLDAYAVFTVSARWPDRPRGLHRRQEIPLCAPTRQLTPTRRGGAAGARKVLESRPNAPACYGCPVGLGATATREVPFPPLAFSVLGLLNLPESHNKEHIT